MTKNLFQDMVRVKRMNEKKHHTIHRVEPVYEEEVEQEEFKPVEKNRYAYKNEEEKPKYKIWIVAVVAIMFLIVAISYLFISATITVYPKTLSRALNQNFLADKNATGDVLPFELVAISGQETRAISTTGQKDVEQKAKGVAIIYNNFSTGTQRLDIDTRLEGSNGKIYKTVKQVMVPGMKGVTPGAIEVGIYGSVAGAEYNSGPLDFNIVGFKGTPKYAKFYARSKGDITGGLKGTTSTISDVDKAKTLSELKTILKVKLFQKASEQIPTGFVMFKDAVFLSTDDSDINTAIQKDNILPVTMKGTLYGFLFNEEKLTTKIIYSVIADYDGSPAYISNIKDLSFSLANSDTISFRDVANIDFTLSGEAKIVQKVDEEKLKSDLLGKSKRDFSQILIQYSNIETAQMVISPFWKRSMPDKMKDIKVIVNYPK